jgi:hypothetical protein
MEPVLINKILKQNDFESILRTHCLEGYAYSKLNMDIFKKTWQAQIIHNTIKFEEINRLAQMFDSINTNPILLKGMSITKDIFEDLGQRSMSDIDILIKPCELDPIEKILVSEGYKTIHASKWRANNFKTVFQKKVDLSFVVIEVHTKILYTFDFQDTSLRKYCKTYRKLSVSDEFFHLIAHLSFQHTFLYLHWMLDLELYYKKFSEQIDWERVFFLAKQHHCLVSVAATLFCLEKYCEIVLPSKVQDFIAKNLSEKLSSKLNFEFLCYPHQKKLQYYYIKHLLKDSFLQSFEYNLLWLGAKINGLVGKR